MDRTEAVYVYKEIVSLSENVGYNPFNIKLSEKNDSLAQSYQIRISMVPDPLTVQVISTVAKKHNLAVLVERGEVVVYQPKTTP